MNSPGDPTASQSPPPGQIARQPVFVTTHWSVVLSARNETSPKSAAALEELCRVYWYPIYAHVRRLGNSPHDAEDLTQEFFARLLQRKYLDAAEQARGRFRSFLLMALKRFLADEWDRARAQKRGGGAVPVPIDTDLAERRFQTDCGSEQPGDRQYERRWAMALLDRTMTRLRQEFEAAGKKVEFEQLKRFLTLGKAEIPYATVTAELGLSESALRVAVHRLRKRFREIFREEIAHTVARTEDVAEEFRHLLAALSP